MSKLLTISDIRAANKAAGGVFFDPSHTKFSRTLPQVYRGGSRVAFVTQDTEPAEHGNKPHYHAWAFDAETGAVRMIHYADDWTFPTQQAAETAATGWADGSEYASSD